MNNEIVLMDVQDGVALITFNHASRNNAWSERLSNAYYRALAACDADPSVRAIVVTGAGKTFCPGPDTQALEELSESGNGDRDPGKPEFDEWLPTVIRKPMIAAINGACASVGLVQALYCDVRFANAGVKFTTSFVRRGLPPEHGLPWLLIEAVGPSRARDLILSGRVFLAEEAVELGLLKEAVADEQVVSRSLEYARDLATWCSPAAMASAKSLLAADRTRRLPDAIVDGNRRAAEAVNTYEFREGVASFVERRRPAFGPL
jgi:enoyl-CoA hydratase/carnithine racemase